MNRSNMKKNNNYITAFLVVTAVGLVFILFLSSQWRGINTAFKDQRYSSQDAETTAASVSYGERQKGAHVFWIQENTNFQPLIESNLEWITMVSWGFQDDVDSPNVTHHDGDSLNMMQHDSGWIDRIKLVRSAGFKVFFKPHLWVMEPSDGKWRSDIFPTNEENWKIWQKTYRDFILRYAKVAEKGKAEMYCIGVEFSRLAVEKPDFWRSLIQEIRSIYSGKLVYAANWYNEFEKITFWEELDFIGVQAYFPLAKNDYPGVEEISKGWSNYLSILKSTAKKYNRKILFTEMGYRSTAGSAIKPWEWVENDNGKKDILSFETQANCYKAFFDTVWEKDWFAGVHIWQMRSDYSKKNTDKMYNFDFTPQGKSAEKIIALGFE